MFPSDFEAKTSHLTLIEDGAYNRLLRICWMTAGCSIPIDEAWIMRRVRAHTEAEQEAVRAVLAEYFVCDKGRYSNARLTRVFDEANDAHEKRKNAGAKGGKSKALKTKDFGPSNATAMLKQPEPEPEPDLEIIDDKSSIIRTREKQRGSRIPPDWQASLKDVAYAVSLGLTDGDIAHEENQFRDYWLAKSGAGGVKNCWAAAWRGWCRNQIKFRSERQSRQAVGRPDGKRITGWDRLAGNAGAGSGHGLGEGLGHTGGPVIAAAAYRFKDG
jgi:uncharacterized protein YdaU (DUF1376 family)